MTSTQSSPRPDGQSERESRSDQSGSDAERPDEQPRADAATAGKTSVAPPASATRATLHYTLMRLGLFVACFVVLSVLAWVGLIPEGIGASNPLWLFALSILISAPLSLVLLRKQRDAMSERIVPKVERASSNFRGRLAENRGREDDV